MSPNGHTELLGQTWYDGLEMSGNTSINSFFYGTYLGVTKPNEPVSRTKKQAFQADAVGVAHQLTPAHFSRTHTMRLEWQAGPGGRIDWFSKGHKINKTSSMEGDGLGIDWIHVFGLRDKSVEELMGSQIPIEPMSLIMNTAVSSTWGFPSAVKETCEKCYDCDDPECACAFAPGFCKMLRRGDVKMSIDSVRVYQSKDPSAHVGANHTIGCDTPEYPSKEWIKGHEYRYMRNPPFSYADTGPIRKVQKGGGKCKKDSDCGGDITSVNLTQQYEQDQDSRRTEEASQDVKGRGECAADGNFGGMFSMGRGFGSVCKCNPGFTGPHCLAQYHIDYSPSAYKLKQNLALFRHIPHFQVTPFMIVFLVTIALSIIGSLMFFVSQNHKYVGIEGPGLRRPATKETTMENELIITGRSV
jgi:hypothetical protein